MKIILKRLLAMILDLLIVTFITTLILSIPINLESKGYKEDLGKYNNIAGEYTKAMTDLQKKYKDKKISSKEITDLEEKYDVFNRYFDKYYKDKKISDEEYSSIILGISTDYNNMYQEASFKLQKDSYYRNIIAIVVLTLYFLITSLIMKGSTIGKKILGIKVVDKDGEKANMLQIFIRTLLNTGLIVLIIELILLLTVNYNIYNKVLDVVLTLYIIFEITSFVFVMYRKDKRGLHDLVAGTKVIDIKEAK